MLTPGPMPMPPVAPPRRGTGPARRPALLLALVLVLVLGSSAQAQPTATAPAPGPAGGAPAPTAAPSSRLAPQPGRPGAAVPELPAQPPDRFEVLPFTNRTTIAALDYLLTAAPFELAEKLERAYQLDPAYGPWVVRAGTDPSSAAGVAAAALAARARWVVTGWVERPSWQLRVGVTLWRVDHAGAAEVARAERTGPFAEVHQLLGALGLELAGHAGWRASPEAEAVLRASTSRDLYAFTLFGRGVAAATGVGEPVDLASARHQLERAVFIDPGLAPAHRLLGDLALADRKDPRATSRAAGRWNQALELAPGYPAALRAAAAAAAAAGKAEQAQALARDLVIARPFDLDARLALGDALWRTGDAAGALRQLDQVAARRPDDQRARRLRVLIHAARGDTATLITDLEALIALAPDDTALLLDLGAAYAAQGDHARALATLTRASVARPVDVSLAKRIGDVARWAGDADAAVAWYGRAMKLAPDDPRGYYALARLHVDRGRLEDGKRVLGAAQRFADLLGPTYHALGVVSFRLGRASEAAWYLRRAVGLQPRVVASRVAVIAAELARRDPSAAAVQLAPALAAWPDEPRLRYLDGVRLVMSDERAAARVAFERALAGDPAAVATRAALSALEVGADVRLAIDLPLDLPLGDARDLASGLDQFAAVEQRALAARDEVQRHALAVLSALGEGPTKVRGAARVRQCPLARVVRPFADGRAALSRFLLVGAELEQVARVLERHDQLGEADGLLPDRRATLAQARTRYRLALADARELRAMWQTGVVRELTAARCSPALLDAAIADPRRYATVAPPARAPTRPSKKAPAPPRRVAMVVDNRGCPDPVRVYVDGEPLGEVAAGARSALSTAAGRRTLCLLTGPSTCGDRGTLRQAYLHEGWAVVMRCPR